MRQPIGSGLHTCAIALLLFVSAPAFALPLGIDGYTGKQGTTCNQCHSAGTPPSVEIVGPTSVTANELVSYSLHVRTGAPVTGAAIAATDGIDLVPGEGLMDLFAEVVQQAPRSPTAGDATYGFSVRAPATNGPLRLWAVGLAANNNGNPSGDAAMAVTFDIMVTGGIAASPDAGTGAGGGGSAGGGADTGAGAGGGGTTSGGSTASGNDPATGSDDAQDPSSPGTGAENPTMGCEVSTRGSAGCASTACFLLLFVWLIARRPSR